MLSLLLAAMVVGQAPCLRQSHAHNDYLHPRPLFDALDLGYTSIEADVFSVGEKLLVAHTPLELAGAKSFQELYLDPLQKLAGQKSGKIAADGQPLWLLVDIKNNPEKTWSLVAAEIARRPAVFCRWEKGRRVSGPVWVVVSGSAPRKAILQAEPRLASVDGRLPDLGQGIEADVVPWISDAWNGTFQWRGKGPVPEPDKAKMRDLASRAKAEGKQLRFWGAPDNETSWTAQREAGVHRIGTDKLKQCAVFLANP
jgi:hypothetical protein